MDPDDFAAWLAMMKKTRRWTKARCSRELGASHSSMGPWQIKGAPLYIGLACAALAYGLPPWRDQLSPGLLAGDAAPGRSKA